MRTIRTIISIIILGVVIWFASGNAGAVRLNLFLWEYSVSLIIIVAVCVLLGFIVGILQMTPYLWKKRSSAKQAAEKLEETELERDKLKKQVADLKQQIANTEELAVETEGQATETEEQSVKAEEPATEPKEKPKLSDPNSFTLK